MAMPLHCLHLWVLKTSDHVNGGITKVSNDVAYETREPRHKG